jgi:excisionase family DNA binding protein
METNEPVQVQEATNELPEILTRREAALFLRVSERHLRTLIKEGRIPEIRLGRRVRRYRKSALLKAL